MSKEDIDSLCNDILNESLFTCCFTGAGISTSSGIPCYRGKEGNKRKRDEIDISTINPTFTHYSITQLVHLGLIDYVVTQNVDNLHKKAGLTTKIKEFHGNYLDYICDTCSMYYKRDDLILKESNKEDILMLKEEKKVEEVKDIIYLCTNPLCPSLKRSIEKRKTNMFKNSGILRNGIQKFGSYIDGFNFEKDIDVSIILGTSLKVEPFASLCLKAKRIYLINLENANPKAEKKIVLSGGKVIHAEVDSVFKIIMGKICKDFICPVDDNDMSEKNNDKVGASKSFSLFDSFNGK